MYANTRTFSEGWRIRQKIPVEIETRTVEISCISYGFCCTLSTHTIYILSVCISADSLQIITGYQRQGWGPLCMIPSLTTHSANINIRIHGATRTAHDSA